jgi:predicted Zn-dependent protease
VAIAALPSADDRGIGQTARVDRYRERTRLLLRENAMVELKVGRSDEAIAQLQRALQLQAHDPVAHYYLGRAYAAKASNEDELRLAAAAFTTATQVDAAFADAFRELAMTHTKLGNTERAAEARQTYIALRGSMSFIPLPTLSGMAGHPLPVVLPGLPEPRP